MLMYTQKVGSVFANTMTCISLYVFILTVCSIMLTAVALHAQPNSISNLKFKKKLSKHHYHSVTSFRYAIAPLLEKPSKVPDTVVGNIYSTIDEITFVSSNINKIKEVKLLLGSEFPWELRCQSLELPELQASPVEISIAKCKAAAELCEGPVIVEDTSLCFNALNGLPGPYIKWFYESIGNTGLSQMLEGFEDKSAYAQCILSFTLGKDRDIRTFVGSVDGEIVAPKGQGNFGWDQIFQPLGYDKTFAEMDRTEKNKISHRFKAFREFKAYLNRRAGS